MTVGLSTYAFFWQWHDTAAAPLGAAQLIDKTASMGVELLQLCDFPPIDAASDAELDDLRRRAADAGVALELGTRGVQPDHLRRYLAMADRLGATVLRSMVNSVRDGVEHRPTTDEAVALLQEVAPELERAGVSLALETYEQVRVATLVDIVARVDSPRVGICLDPGNSLAALDAPVDTIAATAPYVLNLHVKDFGFTRRDGWIGFTYAGAKLGEGLLDYDAMVGVVRPDERGINQIIEHWLPWQGDSATTIAVEDEWARHSITYLRSKQS